MHTHSHTLSLSYTQLTLVTSHIFTGLVSVILQKPNLSIVLIRNHATKTRQWYNGTTNGMFCIGACRVMEMEQQTRLCMWAYHVCGCEYIIKNILTLTKTDTNRALSISHGPKDLSSTAATLKHASLSRYLSEDIGSFYLVSMPGEVNYKCVLQSTHSAGKL